MSEDHSANLRISLEQEADQAYQMAQAIAKSRMINPPPEEITDPPPDPTEPTPPSEAPVNVDVPVITPAEAAIGDTLTCTMGNWEGEPTSYSYKWSRSGASEEEVIPDSPTYVVKSGDAGSSISCVVTATNAVGSTAAPLSNAVDISAAAA